MAAAHRRQCFAAGAGLARPGRLVRGLVRVDVAAHTPRHRGQIPLAGQFVRAQAPADFVSGQVGAHIRVDDRGVLERLSLALQGVAGRQGVTERRVVAQRVEQAAQPVHLVVVAMPPIHARIGTLVERRAAEMSGEIAVAAEKYVQELRAKGLSVRAIARETGYSVGTVHPNAGAEKRLISRCLRPEEVLLRA